MRVALTFDDGIGDATRPILDLLHAHHATATFFLLGATIQGNETLLLDALAQGHEFGNHTYSHKRVTRLPDEQVIDELRDTSTAFYYATAKTMSLWRAPHFDHDIRTDGIARGLGLRHVGCDYDPGDWQATDSHELANWVSRRLDDGVVFDLHDGIPPDNSGTKSRQVTVDALKLILEGNRGVEFTTVSGLSLEGSRAA